jgi:hypothetical protein
MGAFGGPDIVDDGLLIAIDAGSGRSYSGSGTSVSNIIDDSTYTIQNSLSKVSDKGGTWDYDGVDDYISGPAMSFGTLSGYTIAFWARRDSESKMYISTNNGAFYWYGDNSWKYVTGGTNGEYYYPKSVSIPNGTWGYYVATYDGTNTKVYRQGVYEGAKATTGSVNIDSLVWQFGKHAGSGSYYFNGLGGDIFWYNKALTQAEVTQNFNAQKSRFL